MKDLGHPPFIYSVPNEHEPLIERPINQSLLQSYIEKEQERVSSNQNFPVVYDYVE